MLVLAYVFFFPHRPTNEENNDGDDVKYKPGDEQEPINIKGICKQINCPLEGNVC